MTTLFTSRESIRPTVACTVPRTIQIKVTNATYFPTDVSPEPSFRALLVNREDRSTARSGSSSSYSKMMFLSYPVLICMYLIFVGSAHSKEATGFCEPPDWLLCANRRCLSTFFVCDGDDDCGDNSDEQNCKDAPTVPKNIDCAENQFKCSNNRCIPLDDFCDREYDCTDGSDEYIGCTSDKKCNEFRCKNGYCVKNAWVCDGVNDCSDFSDETGCGNRTITSDQCTNEINRFLCNNGRCIALNATCDGKDDCGDNSDEIVAGCVIAEASCKKGIGCSHSCNKTPRGPVCSCPTGYKLINNQSCSDINECIGSLEVCDQRCVNTAGSYYCICEVGYELQDDKKTCKVDGGEALMIFSSKKEIRGFYLESKVYFPIAKNLQHVIGVSLDANYIYWSDIKKGDEAIIRSLDDGTKAEVIVSTGLGLPEEIAVDWITGNVYFTDSLWKHIGACKNDGSYCTVIINEAVDMPRGLALYPMNGEMYWSDFGIKPRISIAGMDGKMSRPLVTENLVWPNGLAIDYPNRRLYWVDAKQETIESVKLDGTDRREVLHTTATHPYSIAIFENKLYWSDWETKSIQSADKFTGKNRTTIVREMDTIYGIHIYHSVLKPKMPNPCNTQPCSQLCLLAVNRTYTCACTQDKELANDKHTCKTITKQEHLIIAAGKTFIDYYHTILGRPKITESHTLHRITHVVYDSVTGTILANDQLSNSIYRYNPDSGEIRQILNINNEYIGGMDFDYYGNNLYWSDVQHRSIEIHSMDTRQKIVINFMEEPRDILVLPEYGIMYVVFKSKEQYHIDKLLMTGAGTREHVVDNLHGPRVTLAFDRELQRVMWADQGTGSIESISVQGINRRLFRSGLQDPVSLAVLGRDIFWTLKNSKRLQWADKQGRIPGNKAATLSVNDNVEAMDLVTTRGIYTGTQHKCRFKNGGCSHVCLVAVTQYHLCACPPGMILNSDKRTCSLQTVCRADEIRCSDNNECINKMRRCNGIQDCPNGEDEVKCDHIQTCGVGEFTCRDGQCIDIKSRCNSYFDCGDQSDEINCDKDSCKRDEFQCLDGQCITKFLVCDGRNDCADFSDETNCGRHICDDSSFRCASGTCIPKSWECDGQNDCGDSSDEDGEKCKISNCAPDMFKCANKRCLGPSLVCDNVDDCGDNSDEENCEKNVVAAGGRCTANEYKCHETEKCISLKLRCNGEQDCPKNDDEHNCAQCEPNEFPCENTKCIPQSWMCDHMDDCGDKSDEKNCDSRSAGNFTTIVKPTDCRQFRCAIGTCLPYDKVCDGKGDCFDGIDEGGKCSVSCDTVNPCQQICQKTPTGPLCLCQEGFSLDKDGKSCTDIDECRQGICPQICHNEPGTYSCSCFDGYVLRSNKISCKVSGEPMEIITATRSDIRKISASLSSIEVIHRQPNVDVTGLDVNMRQETLYWSNELLGTINRLNLKTKEFKLVSGLGRPGVLAIDWATDNVYFHDGEKPSSIKACSLEEQKCASVVKIEGSAKLMSIAIDPRNGWLFWSQTSFVVFEDPTGEIWRTDLSGSNQVNIAHERLGVVSGITIDYTRSRLYWADALLQVVERSDLDGGNRQVFLSQQIYQPLGINIFEDSIYWLMRASGILKKCDLHGDKVCESIKVKSSNVNELFVILQKSRQPVVNNVCQNHECKYMCVIRGDKFACICPNGYLTSTNSTCGKNAADPTALKFESTMLGLKKENVRQEGGFFAGTIISVALGIAAVLSAYYYYYQKKKLDVRNKNDLSIHFQNPSFGRRSASGLTSDLIVPVLPPGEHEYTNPMSQVAMSKIHMPKSSGQRTLELISSDHSENELDEISYTHDTRLIN